MKKKVWRKPKKKVKHKGMDLETLLKSSDPLGLLPFFEELKAKYKAKNK